MSRILRRLWAMCFLFLCRAGELANVKPKESVTVEEGDNGELYLVMRRGELEARERIGRHLLKAEFRDDMISTMKRAIPILQRKLGV